MKYLIIILILSIGFRTMAYSQDTTQANSVFTREKYLRKSDNLRAVSVAMLIIGAVSATIVLPKTNSLEDAVNAIGVSMATGITGIILYVGSIQNRKKAKSVSAGFRFEKPASPFVKSYGNHVPTLSVRFAL